MRSRINKTESESSKERILDIYQILFKVILMKNLIDSHSVPCQSKSPRYYDGQYHLMTKKAG